MILFPLFLQLQTTLPISRKGRRVVSSFLSSGMSTAGVQIPLEADSENVKIQIAAMSSFPDSVTV